MPKKILLLFFLLSVTVQSQTDKSTELFKVLKEQDSIFFERGFNQCDMKYLEEHVSDSLRFYHDQSGYQDKKMFFESIKKNICSNSGRKPVRRVDESSLEVFPLYNNGNLYAAIQKGVHHFYLRESGSEDLWTSIARFTHVWILENNTWILSEVLSYDHRQPLSEKKK